MDEVVAASARPDSAFTWIQAVTEKVAFESLALSHYPFSPTEAFGTLDAKLAAAFANILNGEFEKGIQRRKMEALAAGHRLTGRQILWLIDEYFRVTQADGDLFGMEALLSCSLNNNNLEKFLEDWEYWLASAQKRPEEGMLEALFLRQLRKCTHLQDELRDYDRLRPGDERRCYNELLATARRHLHRVRLQKHRDAMTTAIAGGNALASVRQKQDRNKTDKDDKGKGKGKDKRQKQRKGLRWFPGHSYVRPNERSLPLPPKGEVSGR